MTIVFKYRNGEYSWVWGYLPLSAVLGKQREVNLLEFEANLLFLASSKPVRATQKHSVSITVTKALSTAAGDKDKQKKLCFSQLYSIPFFQQRISNANHVPSPLLA